MSTDKIDRPIGLITFTTESQLRREKLKTWAVLGFLVLLSFGSGFAACYYLLTPTLVRNAAIDAGIKAMPTAAPPEGFQWEFCGDRWELAPIDKPAAC